MKYLLGCFLAAFFSLQSLDATAQISDINSAINKAGRQRMLSQRIAKAYFQIGQKVDVDRSKKVLDASVALFDRQLVELKVFAPNPEIRETYLKLEKSWLTYKDLLLGAPASVENGRKITALSEEVLLLAHQGTEQLEKRSATTAGRLLNLSGRQRMLSQRMAKYYQASAWGIGDATMATALAKARREFSDAHAELLAAPSNTPQLKEALGLVGQQWFFFENALGQKSSADNRSQLAVATTSERILEEMESVVALYERLPH